MSPIPANLQQLATQIAAARGRVPSARRREVTLVAVSKTRSVAEIRQAHAVGQCHFGENYVQEGVAKILALAETGLVWHFIGPLQSNKAKLVAQHFDWVHGIDREKIADALAQHRHQVEPLQVCVQVNVSGEASKSGVAPEAALSLARHVATLPRLKLRGLMTIIENVADAAIQRAQFRTLHGVYTRLVAAGLPLDTLSMGMSQDFPIAIEEGATMVRIGTAIFGARP